MRRGHPTEEEFEAVVSKWPPEVAEVVRAQRRQLTEAGVVTEPLRTRMACEFAALLLPGKRIDFR